MCLLLPTCKKKAAYTIPKYYLDSELESTDTFISENDISTQVLISFREDISHSDACCWLNEHDVKILDMDEQFNYYLVGTLSENAAEALVLQCEIPIIDCAVRNTYLYPCALFMHAIDGFDNPMSGSDLSHGEMVKEIMEEGSDNIYVSAHNVDSDDGISRDKITSDFLDICKQMNDTDMTIVNFSLGVSKYKDKERTTLKPKETFYQDYADDIRWYADLAHKCENKNFIITKAMGNESMHSIDEAFQLSLEQMNDNQRKALKEHMIIVAAKDTRKAFPVGYSNRINHKIEGVNTIMVDISDKPKYQNGTSAAAPLVANWIAKSGFTNASDAIEAINVSTQSDELVSNETFRQAAQKIVNQREIYDTINELSPNSEFTVDGVLKMYVYDQYNDRWKIKVATNDLDQIDDYVAFVVELDHSVDVSPYLEDSDRDMLDDWMQNAIMLVFDGSKRKLASRYAYKRVRVSGDIYVPMAGWRNKTSVVMNLNSIARTEDISIPKTTTTALASTTSVGNNIPNSIEKDLVGQTIYEPSSNGYFPKDWRWTLKEGEVLNVSVLERKQYSNGFALNVLAHLHRGEVKVDAEIEMQYGNANRLQSITVKKIIIPPQTDYSQYVKLEMDYDFFPTLRLYNNSNITLFIGGDYSSGTEYKKFGGVVEPHSSKPVALGSIDSYNIHFAYKK